MKPVTVLRDPLGLFVRDEEAHKSFRPMLGPQSITAYAQAVSAVWRNGPERICESGRTAFRHGEQVIIQPVLFTICCRVMADQPSQSSAEIWFLWPEEKSHEFLQVDQSTVEKP
ncbi:MAG TPA: hypothetical protein VJ020_14455 [Anaerolineales bacterium]|nr:hypothetical protein [Anaerolineales bacterium]